MLIDTLIQGYHNVGALRFNLKEYDLAAEAGAQAIEIGGGSAGSYALLGYASLGGGDKMQAAQYFRRALELDPMDKSARRGLSEAASADPGDD